MFRTPSKDNAAVANHQQRTMSPDFNDVKAVPRSSLSSDSIETSQSPDKVVPKDAMTSLTGEVKELCRLDECIESEAKKVVEWSHRLIELQKSRNAASRKINLLMDQLCSENELIKTRLAAEKVRSTKAFAELRQSYAEQLQMRQQKVERCDRENAELSADLRLLEQQLQKSTSVLRAKERAIEEMKNAFEAGQRAYDLQINRTPTADKLDDDVEVVLVDEEDPLEPSRTDEDFACRTETAGLLVDAGPQLEHAESAQLAGPTPTYITAELAWPSIRMRSSGNVEVHTTSGESAGLGAVDETSADFVATRSGSKRASAEEPHEIAPKMKRSKTIDYSERYSCERCLKEYRNLRSLNRHKQNCGKPKKKCPACQNKYTPRSYDAHVASCFGMEKKIRNRRDWMTSVSVLKCPDCGIFETHSIPGLGKHAKACKLRKERLAAFLTPTTATTHGMRESLIEALPKSSTRDHKN